MYTYKLGGMLITDELYHDDLEAVTFGRKDQNELMHYGIKGQSWGKRRFQNEDGSLTMAGRNRYDVGDSKQAPSPHTDYKSGVRNGAAAPTRLSGSYGSSMTGQGAKAQPVKVAGVSQQTRNDIAARTAANRQRISNTANTGRKAADSLFGRIGNAAKDVGNWATNAYNDASKAVTGAANAAGNWVGDKAKDVGNAVTSTVANLSNTPEFRDAAEAFNNTKHLVTGAANDVGNWATNAYNDASKAVTGAANDAGNYVKNAAQDVSDWFTGDKAGREAQRYDNVVQNFERNGDRNINEGVNTISKAINIKDKYPNVSEANFDKGIKQRNLGYDQHEIASQYGHKANEAQARYENAPRQLLNAAGNWIGDRVSDAGNTVGNVLKPGINAVGNAVRDAGNWVGDRAQDVGNAVGDAYDSVRDTVNDAATGVRDWYTGEGDKRSADWHRNLSTRDTDFLGTGQNLIENHQVVANESREIADNLRKNGDYENAKRYEQNAEAYQRAVDQMTSDRNRNLSNADMYDERYNNAPRQVLSNLSSNISNAANAAGNWVGNAANSAGNAIGNAARDVGDWASNAASDVRDWGAGAVESGKNFFNNLFGGGNKEPEQPTLSDPNERIITENIIPEQRITEQRIPEQRITEQRVPEQRMAEKQAPGGFNSRPLTKEENEIELKRVNDRLNNIDDYYDHLRANNNPQWSNFTKQDIIDLLTKDRDRYQNMINQQQEAELARALSDKPDGVSDEYWREYTFNGGTREQYDAEMQRMRNQNANRQQSSNVMSDKPSNVSDEFWREYTFNGGTRDSYDREMNARKNSKNNQNDSASRKEVVGTVDTSRPHHFTYDPASGQTIVVYDDEKRR